MVSFLTLHRGSSLATDELIAVSTDPELVATLPGRCCANRQSRSATPTRAPSRPRWSAARRRRREVACDVTIDVVLGALASAQAVR